MDSTTDSAGITNIFKPSDTNPLLPMMGMMGNNSGAGVGLGGIGGFVAGALLGGGRNGILGGGGNGDGGSSVNQITLGQMQQTLGDIKASVPLAEGQVQLALAGAQADINRTTSTVGMNLLNQGTQGLLANLANTAATGDKVDAVSTALAIGFGQVGASIERNSYGLSQVINNDGDKTRALIVSYETANANRRETILANELSDLRASAARVADTHGITIQMTNQQNQNQLQFQQQAQAINTVAHLLADVSQIARATNQSLIIGNSGPVIGGGQSANPTNVRV